MKLWSKGLGRLELPLELAKAERRVEDNRLVLTGQIRERKVNWQYRMTFDQDDMVNFLRLLSGRPAVRHLVDSGGVRLWGRMVGRALLLGLRLPTLGRVSPGAEKPEAHAARISPEAGEA